METVIEVRGLTRKFGNLVAVDHVEFEVYRAEIFGFLGPNGAGKTTTVRMLTGVIDPTEGTATIQGHDIRKEPLLSRAHIAVVRVPRSLRLAKSHADGGVTRYCATTTHP